MIRRPPRSTRTDTLFPYTTLFRSQKDRRETMTNQPTNQPVSLCLWYDKDAEEAARFYAATFRSKEHTSELQSLMRISYAVFCLKKKKQELYGTRTSLEIVPPHRYHNNKSTLTVYT